jgi:hypothetical protein
MLIPECAARLQYLGNQIRAIASVEHRRSLVSAIVLDFSPGAMDGRALSNAFGCPVRITPELGRAMSRRELKGILGVVRAELETCDVVVVVTTSPDVIARAFGSWTGFDLGAGKAQILRLEGIRPRWWQELRLLWPWQPPFSPLAAPCLEVISA